MSELPSTFPIRGEPRTSEVTERRRDGFPLSRGIDYEVKVWGELDDRVRQELKSKRRIIIESKPRKT